MTNQQKKIDKLRQLDDQRREAIHTAKKLSNKEKEIVKELVGEGISLYRIRKDTGLDWYTARRWANS